MPATVPVLPAAALRPHNMRPARDSLLMSQQQPPHCAFRPSPTTAARAAASAGAPTLPDRGPPECEPHGSALRPWCRTRFCGWRCKRGSVCFTRLQEHAPRAACRLASLPGQLLRQPPRVHGPGTPPPPVQSAASATMMPESPATQLPSLPHLSLLPSLSPLAQHCMLPLACIAQRVGGISCAFHVASWLTPPASRLALAFCRYIGQSLAVQARRRPWCVVVSQRPHTLRRTGIALTPCAVACCPYRSRHAHGRLRCHLQRLPRPRALHRRGPVQLPQQRTSVCCARLCAGEPNKATRTAVATVATGTALSGHRRALTILNRPSALTACCRQSNPPRVRSPVGCGRFSTATPCALRGRRRPDVLWPQRLSHAP